MPDITFACIRRILAYFIKLYISNLSRTNATPPSEYTRLSLRNVNDVLYYLFYYILTICLASVSEKFCGRTTTKRFYSQEQIRNTVVSSIGYSISTIIYNYNL